MFSQQELAERINAANEAFATGEEIPNTPPDPNAKPNETVDIGTGEVIEPTDIYRLRANARYDEAQKSRPKGSSKLVKAVTECIINGDGGGGGLARSKRKAEDDSDVIAQSGDKARAKMLRQQYMEECFLPSVEAVINYTSPDELLNCKEALNALDSMALGDGSMKGYTAAYVRQAYGDQLGQKEGESDPAVIDAVRRIRKLVDDDQYRTAVGLAKKLKKSIDDGENIASDEDYALLGRIVSYAS